MDVGALAALAGSTLVTAAVTDTWEGARHRFACLFGRGKPDPLTERRLDATRDQVMAASGAEVAQVKAELAGEWAVRLKDLLTDVPEAEAELLVLIRAIRALLPAGSVNASGYAIAAGGDITVSADHGSVGAGVIHGNIVLPGPTMPGPLSGYTDPAPAGTPIPASPLLPSTGSTSPR